MVVPLLQNCNRRRVGPRIGLCLTRQTKQKKRLRRLWITRINAGARMNDMSYSELMGGLKKANIDLDRKVLANLAILDAGAFTECSR